jgi:PAS domain S-box-containing protein
MDIRTLAIVLGITHVIQLIVFSLQAWINRTYRGIGWWLLWSATAAMGFVFILLRSVPAIEHVSIIAQNALIVLGTVFLYIGIVRFLDRKEQRRIVFSLYAAFLTSLTYFAYVDDDIAVRTVILCLTLAATSFLSAHALLAYKTPALRATAYFCTAVFLAHGAVFLHRTAMVLAGTAVGDVFRQTLFNVIPFLDAILVSLLWTCGLIIMINQRLNAETKEARERFELLFHTSPDAVLITRAEDGLCREANEGFFALSGFSRAEVVGRLSLELNVYCDPADRQRIVDELSAKGCIENIELLFRRKDGSRLTGIMSARLFSLDGVPHVISVTRDISARKQADEQARHLLAEVEASRGVLLSVLEDQKRAELEVRRLNVELEQRVRDRTAELSAANSELEAFSYSVSHDLRAPLRAINGYAHILTEDHATALDAEGHRVLGVVRAEALRMGRLIDDLLEFSRLGRQSLRKTPTDVTALVREVQTELLGRAPDRAVDFRVDSLPAVSADPALLRQVWLNLLGNALKYTRLRTPAEITVAGSIEGPEAVYSVKDNGTGFDMRYADRLFGIFQRLHRAEEFEGTGLGLALVQRVVHRHGGRVWAEAELDRGATFHFALPLAPEHTPAEEAPITSDASPPLGRGTQRS